LLSNQSFIESKDQASAVLEDESNSSASENNSKRSPVIMECSIQVNNQKITIPVKREKSDNLLKAQKDARDI